MTQGNPTSLMRRRLLLGSAAATAAAATGTTGLIVPATARAAAEYPERPITFICPWPVGGTADQSMRALCQVASGILKQSIVVENRAGASGMIGTKALARATPDGYTIGQIPISVTRFSQLGLLQLDPRTELTYLARTSGQTFGIAVPANSRFKTLADVIAEAKARIEVEKKRAEQARRKPKEPPPDEDGDGDDAAGDDKEGADGDKEDDGGVEGGDDDAGDDAEDEEDAE